MATTRAASLPIPEKDVASVVSHAVTNRAFFALGWVGRNAMITIDEKDFKKLFVKSNSKEQAIKNIVAVYNTIIARQGKKTKS